MWANTSLWKRITTVSEVKDAIIHEYENSPFKDSYMERSKLIKELSAIPLKKRQIISLQEKLESEGIDTWKIDGILWKITSKAIWRYQIKYWLEITHNTNRETLNHMWIINLESERILYGNDIDNWNNLRPDRKAIFDDSYGKYNQYNTVPETNIDYDYFTQEDYEKWLIYVDLIPAFSDALKNIKNWGKDSNLLRKINNINTFDDVEKVIWVDFRSILKNSYKYLPEKEMEEKMDFIIQNIWQVFMSLFNDIKRETDWWVLLEREFIWVIWKFAKRLENNPKLKEAFMWV